MTIMTGQKTSGMISPGQPSVCRIEQQGRIPLPALLKLHQTLEVVIGLGLFVGLVGWDGQPVPGVRLRESVFLIFMLSIFSFSLAGVYRASTAFSVKQEIFRVMGAFAMLYGGLCVVGYVVKIVEEIPLQLLFGWMIAWPGIMIVERMMIHFILRRKPAGRSGGFAP